LLFLEAPMPVSLPLVAYLLIASFSLHMLAVFLYCHDRRSAELRWAALTMVSAGAATLALASLLWMEIRLAAKPTEPAPTPAYATSATKDAGAN
jgi:hypothetical protein